jgi:TPR repeat protein
VLLVDACRNDPDPGRGRGVDRPPLHNPSEGLYAFYSCKEGERAYEHPDLKHGVFFHNLLEGLRGRAARADEDVSVEELATYVRKRVPDDVARLFGGKKQNPTVETARASGKPAVLLPKRAEEAELEKELAEVSAVVKRGGSDTAFIRERGPARASAWEAAAERGSARGMCLGGLALEAGGGVAKDGAEAAKWYKKAADQGFAIAQSLLGYCYYTGYGVAKGVAEAVKWYRKAAEQGHAPAQRPLGRGYERGDGVPRDDRGAVKWYRRSAEQGHAKGELTLGRCYLNGVGAAKDAREGVSRVRKAADQGFAAARNALGNCYFNGVGVAEDAQEAARWARKAAEQGGAAGQNNLGVCYQDGIGVSRDPAGAARWYKKAAEQGYARAQYNLGTRHENGTGVAQDRDEAIKRYRKAAKQEPKAAAALKRLGVEPWPAARPAPELPTDAPQLRQAIGAHRDCIAGETPAGRRAPPSTRCRRDRRCALQVLS